MDNWDKFTIGSFALWAGDFDYFESVVKEFLTQSGAERSQRIGVKSTDDLVRDIASLRIRQLAQKKREFVKLANQYEAEPMTPQPTTLKTPHLRAAVWRVGIREFVMYGYLTDLDFEKELLKLSQQMSRVEPGLKNPVRQARTARQKKLKFYGSEGSMWSVEGNPFIQVELSNMGLIRATAVWTERFLPISGDQITEPLLDVLRTLEPQQALQDTPR